MFIWAFFIAVIFHSFFNVVIHIPWRFTDSGALAAIISIHIELILSYLKNRAS